MYCLLLYLLKFKLCNCIKLSCTMNRLHNSNIEHLLCQHKLFTLTKTLWNRIRFHIKFPLQVDLHHTSSKGHLPRYYNKILLHCVHHDIVKRDCLHIKATFNRYLRILTSLLIIVNQKDITICFHIFSRNYFMFCCISLLLHYIE